MKATGSSVTEVRKNLFIHKGRHMSWSFCQNCWVGDKNMKLGKMTILGHMMNIARGVGIKYHIPTVAIAK